MGYSLFPEDIIPTGKIWAEFETEGKMVWFKEHETVCCFFCLVVCFHEVVGSSILRGCERLIGGV